MSSASAHSITDFINQFFTHFDTHSLADWAGIISGIIAVVGVLFGMVAGARRLWRTRVKPLKATKGVWRKQIRPKGTVGSPGVMVQVTLKNRTSRDMTMNHAGFRKAPGLLRWLPGRDDDIKSFDEPGQDEIRKWDLNNENEKIFYAFFEDKSQSL